MVQVYVPRAMDTIAAFEAGQQGAMTRRKEEGARQIGGLMASGDYKGASAAAFGTGDYATGAQLEKIGTDRETSSRRLDLTRRLSAGGKADEIAQEALAGGDLEYFKELDGIAEKDKLTKAKAFGGILRAIGSEPEDAWDDLILANRGQLEALDISPAEIDFFAQSDPAQRRVLMSTMLSRADMLDKYLDDRRQDTKADWKEIKNADGSTYYQDFNDRNGGAQPQSQPVTQNAGGAIDPQHLDAIVRTVWGEARNEVPEGQSAVASVILNRARSTGKTPAEIVREQNQFEPWGNPKTRADLEALDPNSEAYQSILRNIAPALSGQDVTGGADHFYSPTAQSALGRKPPSWDNGKGRDLGRHRFFSLGYGGGSPQAAPRMAAAAPQPTAEPVLAGGTGNDAIQPYEVASIGATPAPPSGPRTRQGSAAPRPEWQDQPDGSQVNIRTGERKGDRTGAGGYTPKQTNEATVELKGKFEGLPHIKAFRDVQASYAVISSIAKKKDPTAADDLSLIFSYMKMLDPGSVVREGEFANAQNTGGVPDVVVNAYNKALSGNRLNARQRSDFANTAGQIVIDRRGQFDTTASEYRRLAQDVGANPDRIAPDPSTWKAKAEAAKKAAPAAPAAPANKAELVKQARDAIAKGAPRAAVIQRLREQGVDTKGL